MFTQKCLPKNLLSSYRVHFNGFKYLNYDLTGEEQYHCVAVHKRSANVLEFQIGNKIVHQSSLNGGSIDSYLGGLESICSDEHFDKSHVMTQARLDSTFELSPCPIDGEFVGLIPDAEDLCARLWSDCDANDTMNYQVSFCGHDEIFDGEFSFSFGHFGFLISSIQMFIEVFTSISHHYLLVKNS